MFRKLATALLIAAFSFPISQGFAQLPTMTLGAGMHVIQAEVANTNETRMQGLMHRKSLGANSGMLFVFPGDEAYCMWMKNTYIPLSVAFLDTAGRVLSVHEMKPETENSHCAAGRARFALEMNAGWFRSKGVTIGMKISGLDKAPPPR